MPTHLSLDHCLPEDGDKDGSWPAYLNRVTQHIFIDDPRLGLLLKGGRREAHASDH